MRTSLSIGVLTFQLALGAAASGSPPEPVEIHVRPAGKDGLWRATYRFARPAHALEFQRGGGFRRAPAWRVETPGYTLGGSGKRETLRLRKKARPRKEITLAFPVDTSHPEKDYQLFERFSDGGLLLYTGHLNVQPEGTPDDAPLPPHRFTLTPRRGEHLIVQGRLHKKGTTWEDTSGEGTYVYFGRLVPLETEHATAVLDPAAPTWLMKRLREGIPALFADYTRLTGFPLESRPTVLFSFKKAADPRSTSWKGGVLPGIIQMHVEAAAARSAEPTPRPPGGAGGGAPPPNATADAPEDLALLRRFYKFLAHEAAHLWNGQLFQSVGKHESWLHEGGADAFAWRAMKRAGLLDEAGLEDRQAEDLNDCLAGLGADSLQAAEQRGEFRPVYACGSALAWLTEAAVRRADSSADLHTFWAALFAASKGRSYDEALYLKLLRERADPSTVAFLEDFLHRPMPDRSARTLSAFLAAGIPLSVQPGSMPASNREGWGERALLALMRFDCDGRFSVSRRKGAFTINGLPACRTLKATVDVQSLEGHPLVDAGDAAYDALAARCAAGEPVTLERLEPAVEADEGARPLTVPCRAPVPPRPPWLAVTR